MTAKEFLTRAFTLDKQIKAKEEQIRRLRDLQLSAGGVIRQGKVKTSPKTDPMGDLSAQILDLIDEYATDVTRLLKIKHDIKAAIGKVENPTYRLILEERYINLKRWEDVASDNHYSWQWVHKIHKKALKAIEVDYDNKI